MLLTTRLICQFCKSLGQNNDFSRQFEDNYQTLIKLPTFKDIRLDLLFENFDRRIELAKQVDTFNFR